MSSGNPASGATPPGPPAYGSGDTAIEDQEIRSSLEGDLESFARLVRRHEKALYNFLIGSRVDPETAMDLSQETLIKAFRNLATFDRERARFKTWLLRIAFNLVRDRGRRLVLQRREAERMEARIQGETRSAEGLEGSIAGKDEAGRLLALLDEETRALVGMRFYDDLPYEDIAEITGQPVNTVRSKVHRALKKLRVAAAGGGEPS